MFHHALVAVDFSPATDPMLDCLPQLSRFGVGEFTLVYVMDIGYPRGPETEHLDHYRSRLEELGGVLQSQGFTVHTEVRIGYPAPELLASASENRASLIVIGSHGHSAVGEVVLGSVAREVLHKSVKPVLLIRLVTGDKDKKLRLACSNLVSHILYASDFSPSAEKAFGYLEEISGGGIGRITLMHVEERESANAGKRLGELAERLTRRGVQEVEVLILHGSPGEEIVRWSEEHEVSMIVMGSHRKGLIADLFQESVSHHIVRNSRSPVLVAPDTG